MRTLRRHFHQIQKLDVPRIPAANDGNNEDEDEDEDEDEQGEYRHDEEEEEETTANEITKVSTTD